MKTSIRRIAQSAGIVAAVAVPALVVGQNIQGLQNLDLSDGSVLRGQDVRALRDALAAAIARIDQLESASGAGISKDKLYTRSTGLAVPMGARVTASASCDNTADVALDCACGGDTGPGTSGSPGNDLRIIIADNPAGGRSSCQCVGENVLGAANQRVLAIVTCLAP